MKNRLENNKGVTLVALTITVVILLIVTNITIYNVKDNLGVEKLKNMQNDIENLSDKISEYFAKYGTIPAKIEYTNINQLKAAGIISEKVDTGSFYVVDLSAIENLTLTYGEDYKKITSETTNEEVQELEDLYIINKNSHNIFYAKGIVLDNEVFYTNYTKDDVDTKEIDLRYVENIKIPDGCTYIEGTKETGIIINNVSENKQYKWIVIDKKITTIPDGIVVDDEESFLKSANLYLGYYKSTQENDTAVIYIPLEERWSSYYDISAQYKDKNGDIVVIPKDFQVSEKKGENTVNQGLVIQDKEQNSYVWIKVPKNIYTNTNYTINNNGNTVTSDTDYTGIYNILSAYASDYRNENYEDQWYAIDNGTYITEQTESLTESQKNLTNGCGLSYDQYISLRNEMLKSIYNNGGFWISQYEVGANSYVSSNDSGERQTIIKEDIYPYNYITCPQAQKLASSINSSEKTSSLLFGIQWDLVLKFMENNGDKTQRQIKNDSTDWGNYANSQFFLKKGKFLNYDSEEKLWTEINSRIEKTQNSKVLLTTGATDRNSNLNIYDLAGNLWEWTLEKANSDTYPCTVRGGNFYNTGDTYGTSSYRGNDNCDSSYANYSIGFRITLY